MGILDFLSNTEFLGAIVGGLTDTALEAYVMLNPAAYGTFPYITLDPLPPADDLIAEAGVPIAEYAIGHMTKRETLKKLGQGGLIYGLPTLLRTTMARYTGVSTYGIGPTQVVARPIVRPVVSPTPPLYGERVSPQVPITNHVRYVISK